MGLRKKLAPSLPFRARKAFGGEGFISKFMYIGYMTRLVVSKRFWAATYFEPTEFIGSAPVGYGFGRYLEPEAAGWVTYPVIQYVEESDIVDTIIPAKFLKCSQEWDVSRTVLQGNKFVLKETNPIAFKFALKETNPIVSSLGPIEHSLEQRTDSTLKLTKFPACY